MQRERPRPGQESAWDYPRPPLAEPTTRRIQVIFGGVTIADTTRAVRVLERGHPPVYYVPREDIIDAALVMSSRATYCEFKGEARYFTVLAGDRMARDAAWTFPSPARGYEELTGLVAFYPREMDACLVDGDLAAPQPGHFYGGWITTDVVGPFVGEPDPSDW